MENLKFYEAYDVNGELIITVKNLTTNNITKYYFIIEGSIVLENEATVKDLYDEPKNIKMIYYNISLHDSNKKYLLYCNTKTYDSLNVHYGDFYNFLGFVKHFINPHDLSEIIITESKKKTISKSQLDIEILLDNYGIAQFYSYKGETKIHIDTESDHIRGVELNVTKKLEDKIINYYFNIDFFPVNSTSTSSYILNICSKI